jgi:hypothetical protein
VALFRPEVRPVRTAQPCGGRLELDSGEVLASTGREVVAQAPLGPRVGTGVVGRPWLQEERGT